MNVFEIRVPEMGEGVTQATVARWHKAEGDAVAAGELVVDVMTDKVGVEIEAPVPGVLEAILHGADEEVAIGTVIGRIRPAAAAP